MTPSRIASAAALLFVASACSPNTSTAPAYSAAATAASLPEAAPTPGSSASATGASASTPSANDAPKCTGAQFVACHTGEECSRRGGEFVHAKACYERATSACDAAACEFGCDIYETQVGGPKMVSCAPNASSTGHMKVCGGLANWACPEGHTCQRPSQSGFDAKGTCVASDS